jgi:NAD(P)H dehydrogenase (quinone)
MAQALVCYYSKSGNTEKMAHAIADAIKKEGVTVDVKKVEDTRAEELLNYDAIVIGSPTYYGTMSWQVKKLLDESVVLHGRLKGKIGGAFSSSINIAGGNETTILDIIDAMLIHGMIVQGEPIGDHYGPVAIGSPDERSCACCTRLAGNVASLVKKLYGKRNG